MMAAAIQVLSKQVYSDLISLSKIPSHQMILMCHQHYLMILENLIEHFKSKLAQAKIDAMAAQRLIKLYEELLKSASEKGETK